MCAPIQKVPFASDPATIRAMQTMKNMMLSGDLSSLPDNMPFPLDIMKSMTIEYKLDIEQVSAQISQRLTDWDPLFVKVTNVMDEKTFEITSCDHPVGLEEFWADDRDNAILSRKQKERLHLQYHRSFGTHGKVLAFVSALQVLCDSGISFHYDGRPVVDILVATTPEFDISDIMETRVLHIIDPVHHMAGHAVNNHERIENLRMLDRKAYRKLGMEAQSSRQSVEYIKTHRPVAYRGSMPHWWVIAVTEGPKLSGVTQRSMVHIDVCGAAFDDLGFQLLDGKLVSLHVFTTPEYVLLKNTSSSRDLKPEILSSRRFIMHSGTRSTVSGLNNIVYCPQPYSMRHLRCFLPQGGSSVASGPHIDVFSLDTFVSRSTQFMPGNLAQWYRIISELRHKLVLEIPPATPVVIQNLKKRPELNGRNGDLVMGENAAMLAGRVAVTIKGEAAPLSLRTTCIALTDSPQYKSHAEILEEVEKSESDTGNPTTEVLESISKDEEEACYKALHGDSSLMRALDMLNSNNITIASFADPSLAESLKKLTIPPFDRIIPMERIDNLKEGLAIADHPKFSEAFKIVKLINHAKQRVRETDPGMIAGDGSVLIGDGSDFERLVREVTKKIKHDKGLTEVFELMNERKLFPNPVEQWGPYSL